MPKPWCKPESPARTLDVAGRNHFTILDDLAAPDGPLWLAVEDMLNRGR